MATMKFKQQDISSRTRALTSEDSFAKGICMTNAPEESGYAKMLVNFKLKNEGSVLATRPAIVVNSSTPAAENTEISTVLFTNTVECAITDADHTVIKRFAVVESNTLQPSLTELQSTEHVPILCIPVDDTKKCRILKDGYTRKGMYKHDVLVDNTADNYCSAVQTKLNTTALMMYSDDEGNHLGQLKITFTDATCTAATWELTPVVVKDVLPAQAINYGYNMLKEQPYTFNNVELTSGTVTLLGVLPYDADTNEMLLTAKLGTSIKFKLTYKYPKADRDNTKEKYYTSWEVYDLDNPSSAATVVQAESASPLITPGDEISLVHAPAMKSFGLVVKLYKLTDISDDGSITTTAQLKTKLESMTDKYIAPTQIITLASYYLTNDEANAKANNLELVRYDIAQAQGMCSWRNKLVLWGVRGAEHILFTSDINNPGYFPYPNGVEVFDNVIIKAVPYLDKLLVFTTDALYMLTLDASGLTYTVNKVQDRLAIAHADSANIVPVLNMVHFKSGNYYYMIVPKIQSLTGELQLAPISRPIEQLLDNFKDNISEVLSTVYNLTYDNITLLNSYTYVADNNICSVYKIACKEASEITNIVNVVLRYDTNIRAWTIWTYGAGTCSDHLYEITATGDVKYVSVKDNALVILKEDNNACVDTFYTDINNTQYLDTGFRKHAEQLKKRFREVQFAVNSLQEVPIEFYTAFNVDEDERKSFYKHSVVYCNDPNDPQYGNIVVQRELDEPSVTPSITELDTAWTLDTSQFPDLSVYKIRYKVSGKGYGGRVQILCKPTNVYELLYIAWVYRVMNAR